MSKTLASLIIRVGADVSGAVSKMTTVEKASRSLKKEFTGLSAATLRYRTAMVAAFAGGVMALVIKNSMEAQRATAQLGAVLKSTGGVSGQTMASLDSMATALERTTIYGDEAVKSVQGLLLTFTRIKGGEFKQATQAVLAMATALGSDTKTAAIQVGKALQDPILGITALRKAGVNFSAGQKAVIKDLVDTGRAAEAQAMILKELQVEFGGSAEAARKTLGGAIAFLSNQMGNFFEVSQEGSGVFISAINSMGEAVIWAREKAMVPFFGGIQMMAADAAVYVAKLRVAWEDLRALFGILLPDKMSSAGAARDNLARLQEAAAGVKAEVMSTNWAPYVAGLASVGDGAGKATGKLSAAAREMIHIKALMAGRGPRDVLNRIYFEGQEWLWEARAKGEEFKSRGGPITLFDLRPSAKLAKYELDKMAAHLATTKDKMLSTAMMFRDGFADAIADAVMSGKLSFRSFADFVIAELIRIQTRKIFTQLLGSIGGGAGATASGGGGTYTGGARISSPSFNLGPASASGATVVNQTINFSVSAIDSRDAARFVQEQRGAIAGVVAEAARSSGGYRRALAGA